MLNTKVNYFSGDVYIDNSLDSSIYGDGNLSVSGSANIINNITIGGNLNVNNITSQIVSTANLYLSGSNSGVISIVTQSNSGTYNLNLPTTGGTQGQILVNGGTNPMYWITPIIPITSIALTVPLKKS
jgi:hypothetical protein